MKNYNRIYTLFDQLRDECNTIYIIEKEKNINTDTISKILSKLYVIAKYGAKAKNNTEEFSKDLAIIYEETLENFFKKHKNSFINYHSYMFFSIVSPLHRHRCIDSDIKEIRHPMFKSFKDFVKSNYRLRSEHIKKSTKVIVVKPHTKLPEWMSDFITEEFNASKYYLI